MSAPSAKVHSWALRVPDPVVTSPAAVEMSGLDQGHRPNRSGGRPLWIVPNPSGRNPHAPLPTLITAYSEVTLAAGVEPFPTGDGRG